MGERSEKEVKKQQKCSCGEELPTHLLFAINSHTCSCGVRWSVERPKTDQARFVGPDGSSPKQ